MIIPPLLKKGDGVRVIAPARSLMLPWMSDDLKARAKERLTALGLNVSFGKYVNECDEFSSTTIEHRIEDLHDAFSDPSVALVLTVIGGYNCNQLLGHIDYDLIRKNPKRLCGYSDITALASAINAKTGIVTYSGPHFFNFGQKNEFDYTLDSFVRCHFHEQPFTIEPSKQYVDGRWANAQDDIERIPNKGWLVFTEGTAEGTIVGGNVGTLALLFGTEYMPQPEGDIVLFIEEDGEDNDVRFDRILQSLCHQPWMERVRGVVLGRFERESGITDEKLITMLRSKAELRDLPIIANVDFGHSTPMATLPLGGRARFTVARESRIEILSH